ncbi:Protein CBG16113 [Caenorhabditis briggsae]|uniref:Protein CBG16113 n=1 Tax=Caenorhabditis briggsae TaxID=6238 RepID=A8XN39_CAEBR|nr:Protein CBG16113 [Caenorhabditis briggsae]CAP34269.2 Protein CBG16113 [Caenorhabditis briggsae]
MKNFNEDKDRNEKELKEALLKFQEKNIEQVREIEDFKKAKQMFENEIKQLKEEKKTFELEREAEKKKHMDSYDRMNEEWQTKTTGLEEKQRKKLEEITSEYQSVLEEQKEENEDIKKERDELKKNKVRLEAAKKKMEEEKRILEVTEMDQENEKQQLEMGRDAEKRKKKDLLDDHSKKLDDLVREHQSVLEDQEKKKEEKEEVGDGIGEVVCRACRIRCATSPVESSKSPEWILDYSLLFATTTEVKEAPKKAIRSDIMTRKELTYVRSRLQPWVSSSQAHHEEEEEGSTGKTNFDSSASSFHSPPALKGKDSSGNSARLHPAVRLGCQFSSRDDAVMSKEKNLPEAPRPSIPEAPRPSIPEAPRPSIPEGRDQNADPMEQDEEDNKNLPGPGPATLEMRNLNLQLDVPMEED